jgi:hypothetical protein
MILAAPAARGTSARVSMSAPSYTGGPRVAAGFHYPGGLSVGADRFTVGQPGWRGAEGVREQTLLSMERVAWQRDS